MKRYVRISGDRRQQPADERPPAYEVLRGLCAEPFPVQRATYPLRQLAEAFGGKRFGHCVSQSVETGVRQSAVVVRPGQHVELEVSILLEVRDQIAAAVHVGALQLHRCAIADRGVEVGKCGIEGVVASCALQRRVAGKPHPPSAGVGGGAPELISGLHDHDGQPFAGGGVRADQATTGAGHYDVGFVVPGRHAFTMDDVDSAVP